MRKGAGHGRIAGATWVVNALVLGNVLVALSVEYHEAKLPYFVMLAMVFAFAAVTLRQALVSVGATVVAMLAVMVLHPSETMQMQLFVGFAAVVAAIGIAVNLRHAVGHAVRNRAASEDARAEAEHRLASARKLGDKMRRQSLSDSLTGLPNRRAFFRALKASRRLTERGTDVWMAMLDLDGFKAVNDNYGHLIGDTLLSAVAARMSDYCQSQALVARMGGDEFAILVRGMDSDEAVRLWFDKLLEKLAEVYLVDGRLVRISGSIGFCHVGPDGEGSTALQKADFALLYAKRNGKNRVVMFCVEHALVSAERFRIEQALRSADFARELEVLFQPQFDLTTNRVSRAEVLVRWNSPSIGLVGPDRFIQVAEESGLVSRITGTVLRKALMAIQSGRVQIPLSINLSGNDLLSDQLTDELIAQLEDSGVSADMIEFEITETAMMSDVERAKTNLERLAGRGHTIALDDFGCGYSNFGYLRTLPINKLKIDRSFIQNLQDPLTEKLIRSLIGLARSLDVPCLIEGIEDELGLLLAKRAGAQMVQGFHTGRPMNAALLNAHLAVGGGADARVA